MRCDVMSCDVMSCDDFLLRANLIHVVSIGAWHDCKPCQSNAVHVRGRPESMCVHSTLSYQSHYITLHHITSHHITSHHRHGTSHLTLSHPITDTSMGKPPAAKIAQPAPDTDYAHLSSRDKKMLEATLTFRAGTSERGIWKGGDVCD